MVVVVAVAWMDRPGWPNAVPSYKNKKNNGHDKISKEKSRRWRKRKNDDTAKCKHSNRPCEALIATNIQSRRRRLQKEPQQLLEQQHQRRGQACKRPCPSNDSLVGDSDVRRILRNKHEVAEKLAVVVLVTGMLRRENLLVWLVETRRRAMLLVGEEPDVEIPDEAIPDEAIPDEAITLRGEPDGVRAHQEEPDGVTTLREEPGVEVTALREELDAVIAQQEELDVEVALQEEPDVEVLQPNNNNNVDPFKSVIDT